MSVENVRLNEKHCNSFEFFPYVFSSVYTYVTILQYISSLNEIIKHIQFTK